MKEYNTGSNKLLSFVIVLVAIAVGLFIFAPVLFQKYNTIDTTKKYKNVIIDHNTYQYHYFLLNEKEKALYDEFYIATSTYKDRYTTKVTKFKKEEAERAFQYLIYDHPEIFWAKNYSLNVGDKYTYFKFSYEFNESEAKDKLKEMKKVYGPLIDAAKTKTSDREKVDYIYNELLTNSKYSKYHPKDRFEYQSIVSIFTTRKTVCTGFSYGFKFMMDELGIPAVSIPDYTKLGTKDSHIWNGVLVDGTWYYLDLTWGQSLTPKDIFYRTHEIPSVLPDNLPTD